MSFGGVIQSSVLKKVLFRQYNGSENTDFKRIQNTESQQTTRKGDCFASFWSFYHAQCARTTANLFVVIIIIISINSRSRISNSTFVVVVGVGVVGIVVVIIITIVLLCWALNITDRKIATQTHAHPYTRTHILCLFGIVVLTD